jgi:lysozyme
MKTLLLLLAITSIAAADQALVENLKAEEGFSSKAYKDSLGFWTIGYGHQVSSKVADISKSQAEVLLQSDITKAQSAVTKLVGKDLNPTVRLVITSMVFQMGEGGVAKFKNTLKLLRAKNYKAASVEMLKSDWADQTPERAKRLSVMIAGLDK